MYGDKCTLHISSNALKKVLQSSKLTHKHDFEQYIDYFY